MDLILEPGLGTRLKEEVREGHHGGTVTARALK